MKQLQAVLTDDARCEFIAVAIPEKMSLEETVDMIAALKKLKVPVRRLLLNRVIPSKAAQDCWFCSSRLNSQERSIAEFRKGLGKSVDIYTADQRSGDVNGVDSLLKHFECWRLLTAKKMALFSSNELVKKPAR